MAHRVRIYDRGGIGLADIRVTPECSWVINDEGEGEFDIVVTDENCREDYLRFGNWLLFEFDNLEPWVGMIDEPQEWRRRYVRVRAYTPDRQLFYRAVPRQLMLSGKSGNIFKKVINLCNNAEPTIIEIGDTWAGGPTLPKENMSGDNLQRYVLELAKRAHAEWSFTPVPSSGRLTIKANWHKQQGIETNFPLEESFNLADDNHTLRRQNKVFNELWGYGGGVDQIDKPTAIFSDAESEATYGLRQGTYTYSDYSTQGSIKRALQNRINQTKDPINTYKLSALDISNTFSMIRQGNIHPLRMWSVGFGIRTNVRVMGMYHNPYRGRLELTLKEMTNDSTE